MKRIFVTRAFSTLELMIALMILTTTLTAVVLIALGIPSALAEGYEREGANEIADNLLKDESLQARQSFSSIVSIATSTNGQYQTSLEVTLSADGLTKNVVSAVSWLDLRGQKAYVEFTGLVTDFNEVKKNSCSDVLSGDWTHPLSTTLSLTSSPIQTLTAGSLMLVAAVTSSVARADPNLFFFTIASSTNPELTGSLDTATSTRAGFAGLAVSGDLVYGASANAPNFDSCTSGPACSQLQIVDMNNPATSTVIENFKLATSSAPFASGSGGQSSGKSIFYANGLLYLGLQKTANGGDEFNIINVVNPRNPSWIGGFAVGRTVNQIEVANGYAYLATDDPSRELIILNVQNPANITFAGSYDAPGNTAFGFGETLALASSSSSESILMLGRSYILNEPQFTLLDVSSPASLAVLGNEPIDATSTDSIEDITLRGFLAFVLTSSRLEFWNIINPSLLAPYAPALPLPGSVVSTNGLTCIGNTLYVASSDPTHTGYLTAITGS